VHCAGHGSSSSFLGGGGGGGGAAAAAESTDLDASLFDDKPKPKLPPPPPPQPLKPEAHSQGLSEAIGINARTHASMHCGCFAYVCVSACRE
jgi:hypothetical protein